MKYCIIYNSEIINKKSYKFCSKKCRDKFHNKKNYNSEKQRFYLDRKRQKNTEGLIQCSICGKYYKFLDPHLRQTHKMSVKEYKEEYGINRSRGLITNEIKKIKRDYVKETYPKIIENNLIKKGKKTRFVKGDKTLGKYKRREETLQTLKQKSFIKRKII